MEYSFNVEHANNYGVNQAIILKNLIFWIQKNIANSQHYHDERTWSYNSIRAFKTLFPFWTERQINICLNKLIKANVLKTGNYNKIGYDRTLWYAFVKEEDFIDKAILHKRQMDFTEKSNRITVNVKPIPYLNPDKNHIKNIKTGKPGPCQTFSCGKARSEEGAEPDDRPGAKGFRLITRAAAICEEAQKGSLMKAITEKQHKAFIRLVYLYEEDLILEVFKDRVETLQEGEGWQQILEAYSEDGESGYPEEPGSDKSLLLCTDPGEMVDAAFAKNNGFPSLRAAVGLAELPEEGASGE